MNPADEQWREMTEAAESAGEPMPGPAETEELRHLWERLPDLPEPAERARPAVSFRDLERFQALVGAGGGPAAVASRRLPAWIRAAGIAAVVALVGMLAVLVLMQSRVGRMEAALTQLQASVVVAALNSESAADRLDVLTQLAVLEAPPENLLSAILLRLEVDPSASVRLAAVRSLRSYSPQPRLVDTLESLARRESSPLVRVEIVDLLRRADPLRAERVWNELIAPPLDPGRGDTPASQGNGTSI